jgi:hypothetical protein
LCSKISIEPPPVMMIGFPFDMIILLAGCGS